MSGKALLIVSALVILFGVALLTFVPTRDDLGETSLHWVVPVAYFTMLIGAFGMAWGWYRKNRV
ncbi:MAG: hypothetical protein P1U53_01490 [Sulfitobacter sp.]|nr:hypothetical protein [Sulfitobacter sp.]